MEKETYKIMEYDRIREMLADRASSRIGKEQAETLEPSSDFDEVAEWLAETTEAVTVLETAMPPFGGIVDIRPLLKKAKMGVVLDLDEIMNTMSTEYGPVFEAVTRLTLYKNSIKALQTPRMTVSASHSKEKPASAKDISAAASPLHTVSTDAPSPDEPG